jgi:hypothetical protein
MATKASIVYDAVSDEELKDSSFDPPSGYREISR